MRHVPSLGKIGMALALLSPAMFAQAVQDSHTINSHNANVELEAWNQQHGSHWRLHTDKQTGFAEFIYGGSAGPAFEPTVDEDFMDLALLAIAETAGMHGIEVGTLVHDKSLHLPLGMASSVDKFTVRFRQEVNGVPVLSGYVNALFNMGGELLSVQTSAMPGVASMGTTPAISAHAARNAALKAFDDQYGLPGAHSTAPKLAIGQLESGVYGREAVLVYEVNVTWTAPDMEPEGHIYWISALDGQVVRMRDAIHYCDVGGTVSTMATPDIGPDTSLFPETLQPMNGAEVRAPGQPVQYTDEFGNFNFPGATGPLDVTFRYRGLYTDVNNTAGSDHVEIVSLSGTGNQVTINQSGATEVTPQANIFVHQGVLYDWIQAVNPGDTSWPGSTAANANLNQSCNAYFDGSSINFFQAGGGCPNTAYSTVVAHEMGHWLNVRYGTGNGPDGIGEGNADVFALYLYNTPNLGLDFLGPNSGPLRSGNNNNPFCGDFDPACYGQVHADGQPWMGAAWKVFTEIETSFGTQEADMVTDQIFLGWMSGYDQTGINSVILAQWLTLNDDDGNIDNGTPHYQEINSGFTAQNFPGLYVPQMAIDLVTELEAQNDEFGPYVIDATASSLTGDNIVEMDLVFYVDGGNPTTLDMTSTGGDGWSVGIPGQPSPSVVQFYLRAIDDDTGVELLPRGAPNRLFSFTVGVEEPVLIDNFETNDPDWTTGTLGGTSNLNTDWERKAPIGLGGDPYKAASGTRVWGNTVQHTGTYNPDQGRYQSDMNAFLRTPSMNLSDADRVLLRFNRWLTVEAGGADQARISVNGTEVWSNPQAQDIVDRDWTLVTYDITDAAAGQSDVQIEWSLQSNANFDYGGWTIDDVEIINLKPVTSVCQASEPYGLGKETSWFGYAYLRAISAPSEGAGSFNFELKDAIPTTPGIIFSSASADSVPFAGGTRLVGLPVQREETFFTNALGSAIVNQPIANGAAGSTRYYQAWFRDTNHWDGTGIGLSDGLKVTFCD